MRRQKITFIGPMYLTVEQHASILQQMIDRELPFDVVELVITQLDNQPTKIELVREVAEPVKPA
jgi:hypothetical protein